ncbi:MAG: MBL fold metallo-hydrolase [Candidatus Eisenbacteria bacterium]|nr:MBL fold metallo-hydrolase [Candidatus Eisenbacteria bacterium]
MRIHHHFVQGIAHSSYVLGGRKECAVIDPERDIRPYLRAAEELGLKITRVLQTHLHADFVSGHIDLARATGAVIVAPRKARCRFEHLGVKEGDEIRIDDLTIGVIETPGHTPEHVCYVVTDGSRSRDPVAVFSGDTLFIGDVGRPDLFPGRARSLAASLYDSLHGKLLRLPPFVEVYPAHGAGSLCGRAMSAKRSGTIGYEKRNNRALRIRDRERFIRSLTEGMPLPPDHFSRCSDENAKGPAPTGRMPLPPPLPPVLFREMAGKRGRIVLDVRSFEAFGAQHVPGALHIDLAGNFPTFAGWVIPPDRRILLVADDRRRAEEATILLRKVGLDRAEAYLEGGMRAWGSAGLPAEHVPLLSAEELHSRITGGEPGALIDVRAESEYEAQNIRGSIHIPVADLRSRYRELDPDLPVVLLCSSGVRSSLGASLLKRHGFRRVFNVAGGTAGYAAAGYAPECPLCLVPHGPRTAALAGKP